MSPEILFVFALLVAAIVLFSWERVSFDVTAVLLMSALMLTGILTPAEGLAGFSNPATVTIGAMFVLSEGVRRTGALETVGAFFTRLGRRSYGLALFTVMLTVSVISGFINNTAAVAIFIPVMLGLAANLEVSPSKLLMPMSFAAMLGGVCTLIGTSTNILVDTLAEQHGVDGFEMFDFLPLGLVFLVVGFVYLFTVGARLVPERRAGSELTSQFKMQAYLTDVVLEPAFEQLGRPLDELTLTKDLDLDVLEVYKGEDGRPAAASEHVLEEGDVLRIRGGAAEIRKLLRREDLSLKPTKEWYDVDLERSRQVLIEAVLAPDSPLTGKAIREAGFAERFGAVVLAIRHHGVLQQEELGAIRLSGGDSVLLSMDRERVQEVGGDPSFVLVSELDLPHVRREKLPLALAILAAVVFVAALGLAPIVVTAVTGGVLLLLTGCLTPEEAYQAINWKIIFLLAGVLSLGEAMEGTGAAALLSNEVVSVLGAWGPTAVLSGFFLLATLLTNVISNQATAALLVPIALQAASTLDVSARPFLMAVTYAASLSFMTPVGYQTNTLIYGPGQYRFTDFTKVGTPLNLLFWILATFLIPRLWPF